ncbi:MAG: RsmD family RNA methyltransferase [Elusimicrobiota bacterium]
MRIIAGSARGRKLLSVSTKLFVKPISGRMKQSLFDILKPRIMGAYFLDLFAGTGAVGMEALSRGALKACFVEKDKRCVDVIERNVDRFGFRDKAVVLRADILQPLSWIPFRSGVERFDLVFMGPPYRDEEGRPLAYSTPVLAGIAKADLLAASGWIIAQHHAKEPVKAPEGLKDFRHAKYGDTVISFFSKA